MPITDEQVEAYAKHLFLHFGVNECYPTWDYLPDKAQDMRRKQARIELEEKFAFAREQMPVYVLTESIPFEGDDFLGVFASPQRAAMYAELVEHKDVWDWEQSYIRRNGKRPENFGGYTPLTWSQYDDPHSWWQAGQYIITRQEIQ